MKDIEMAEDPARGGAELHFPRARPRMSV